MFKLRRIRLCAEVPIYRDAGAMRMIRITILAIACIIGLSSAHGQTASDRVERARMKFLAGTFATEITIPPGTSMPKGMTAKGTSVISWALDSMYLSIEDTSTLFGGYRARGALAHDIKTRQFVLSLSNNFGDRPMYLGSFAGDTLVLQAKIKSPKGAFDQKILWYKDGATVRMKIYNDSGKGFLLTLEQTATTVSRKGK